MNYWAQSYSGKAIDFDNIQPGQFTIEDIAIGLSRINRYLGATRETYSVAEHSVCVSLAVEEEAGDTSLALRALLHDAAEAFIGDTTSPVKGWIRRQTYALDVLEARIERAIFERFGLPHLRSDPPMLDEPEIIKRMDLVMLATERRDLIGPGEREWNLSHEPRPKTLPMPLTAEKAERAFLDRFEFLTATGKRDGGEFNQPIDWVGAR